MFIYVNRGEVFSMNCNHRSLERALDILELLAVQKKGMGLSDICRELSLPKSSTFSLIHTLADRKYVNQDIESGKFTLGLKTFEIGSSYIENTDFNLEIKKVVAELAQESEETVHLAILDGTEVVYVLKEESTQTIRMASSIGKRLPAHATAIGKSLLSGISDEGIIDLFKEKQLEQITKSTICDVNVLIRQIQEVRERGFAYEEQESTENVCCLAAPIKDHKQEICAAVSIAVPIFRMNDEKMTKLTNLITKGAHSIHLLLRSSGTNILY